MVRFLTSRLAIIGFIIALMLGNHSPINAATPPRTSDMSDLGIDTTEPVNNMDVATRMETDLRAIVTASQACELITVGESTEGRAIVGVACSLPMPSAVLSDEDGAMPTVLVVAGGNGNSRLSSQCAVRIVDWLAKYSRTLDEQIALKPLRIVVIPQWNIDRCARQGEESPNASTPTPDRDSRELQQKIGELNALSIDIDRDFTRLDAPESQAMAHAVQAWNVRSVLQLEDTLAATSQLASTTVDPAGDLSSQAVTTWELLHQSLANSSSIDLAIRQLAVMETTAGESKDVSRRLTFGEWLVLQDIAYAKLEISAASTTQALNNDATITREYADSIGKWLSSEMGTQLLKQNTFDGDRVARVSSELNCADAELPVAYLLPIDYAWCVSRLQKHGFTVKRVDQGSDGKTSVSRSAVRWVVEELQNCAGSNEFLWNKVGVKVETIEQQSIVAGSFLVESNPSQRALLHALLLPDCPVGLSRTDMLGTALAVGEFTPVIGLRDSIPFERVEELVTIPATEMLSIEKLFGDGRAISYGGPKLDVPRWLNDPATIARPEYVIEIDDESLGVDALTGQVRRLTLLEELQRALESHPLIDKEEAQKLATLDAFSEDWKYALISRNGGIIVYDRSTQKASVVVPEQEEQRTQSPQQVEFGSIPPLSNEKRHVELSSDGKQVAWVQRNDLYVADCESGRIKRLSTDGDEEHLNGTLDWVYQEELYGRGNFKGYWWSPSGRYIAYLSLDQTNVPTYQVSDSTTFAQTLEPTRYPKAGQPLPIARLFVTDTHTGFTSQLPIESLASGAFPDDDRLIVRVTWSPSSELWVQVMNRIQNRLQLVRYSPGTTIMEAVLEESTPRWLEIRGEPKFLPQGDLLWLSDLPDGRTRLHRVDSRTGERLALSSADTDISEIHAITEDGKSVFVSGNYGSPTEQHLVRIDVETGAENRLTNEPGTHRVSVDRSGRFYLDHSSRIDTPPTVRCTAVDGGDSHVVSSNYNDRHRFVCVDHPTIFSIPTTDQALMQAMVMLPKGYLQDGSSEKLPVIVHVYGGPQTPTIRNAWDSRNYWWHQMLTQQGFAVVLCDNRAALGAGIADTWNIAGNMGAYELNDLEATVAWIRAQPWAAPERIGLWGWSYGGYFTAYAMTHTNVFRCGIAGAPVTDWHNYDAIYTERYMQMPQQNEEGYKTASVLESAPNLSGRLLLIHGEKDDNVHISNTLQLVNALQAAGKQFELMIYPKNRHGITDPHQREHLHRLMTDFFRRNL